MAFTLTATPEPSHSPPRIKLEATESDPSLVISSCSFFRDGVAMRFAPTVTAQVALAYDYDAPFDVALNYRADATESGTSLAWSETWASTASWTALAGGAGWSVASGIASAAADGSTIYRDAGGTIGSLTVTSPTNVTIQLLDASALVVASIRVAPDGTVTVTGSSVSSVVGSGSFTVSVSGTSLTVAGTGWIATVSVSGAPTKVQLVAPSAASYVSQFGSAGSGNGQFNDPHGVAIDATGSVLVADGTNRRVQKFNSSGVYQSQFGSAGSGNGQFGAGGPWGIAIDGSGNLWVTDSANHRVQKFNSSGVYQSQFGSNGTGNGQFSYPKGIAIDGSGNIWVVDSANHRVQKFNSSGVYQSQFGSNGTGNGQFDYPWGIAIDGSGNIWVTDTNNHRVQKFNSSGVYQSQFGSAGSGNGQFSDLPNSIAIDGSGNLWVTDGNTNCRVQKFNSSGVYQSQFGSAGTGNGQFDRPWGIAIDGSGNIWVSDSNLDRVQKFTPAGSSIDDVSAYLSVVGSSVSATDTETLSGVTGAWLTNAAQPDLALMIDDCDDFSPTYYLTEETRQQMVAKSTSVQLDMEGSNDVLTVVTGPRKSETWTLEVACDTDAARRALLGLLADNAPVNLRLPADMANLGLDDGFYAVGDVTSTRSLTPILSQMSTVTLPLTPSRAPSFDALWQWNMRALAQTGMTMAQANAAFPTMRDMLIGPTS